MIKKIALLGGIVIIILLFIYCTTDESTIIGPFGNSDKYLTVASLSADKTKLFSKGDTSIVRIQVLDVNNSPAIGLKVSFEAEFGSITKYGITDSSGIAFAVFISDENTGKNTITIDTGVKKYTLTLNVVNYEPKYIELYSELSSLLADGTFSTNISAVLKDSVGNPMPGETVTFTTTRGTLMPSVKQTDSLGVATTVLTNETIGIVTVTATSGITKSIDIKFNEYVPSYIELSATFSTLWADGESFNTINDVLKDSVGNPMSDLPVNFETTLGNLKSRVERTDASGTATTELTSTPVEGVAIVTATAYITDSVSVEFIPYVPAMIMMSAEPTTILADSISTSIITAILEDREYGRMPNVNVLFSTTLGKLSDSTGITNQDGSVETILTSAGSLFDVTANVKAVVNADAEVSGNIDVKFRGIYIETNIDSAKMSDSGIYKAYIRTKLFEDTNGNDITSGAVNFSAPVGTMYPQMDQINGGIASSVFETEVLPTDQNNIIITSELSSSKAVLDKVKLDIPGVEILINTIDDEIMGDGLGWALVKATLREINHTAITGTRADWETTLGTIKEQSKTNTTGYTIDTLRIERAVSSDTDVTITAKYGNNVSISDVVTFIRPVNSQRLILGFESDTTGNGIIPCKIDTAIAVREVGVSALFVDSNGNPKGDGNEIKFSVTPNDIAFICPTDTTESGVANVMMVYPPQHGGEIVRVWGEAPDGTKGSIDVILPKETAGDE